MGVSHVTPATMVSSPSEAAKGKCYYYQEGSCTRKSCPFLHEKMNAEELTQMKAGKKGKGKGKGDGKGKGKASGKTTPGTPRPKKMLCYKFRDSGACDIKDCKYLHVTTEEYNKLNG